MCPLPALVADIVSFLADLSEDLCLTPSIQHISTIIYPSLHAKDSTVAFNKIFLEVLLPLFA